MKTAVDPELQRDVERLVHREHHDPHALLGPHAGKDGTVVRAYRPGAEAPVGWEERARVEVLDGYLEAIDPALLPPTRHEVDQLLAIYELEKAVYELNYELNHRPDWVEIPVAGISRLLEVAV